MTFAFLLLGEHCYRSIGNSKYSEDDLNAAIFEVKNGASTNSVARKYGIPRSTIQFRMSGKFIKAGKGPSSYMTNEEEQEILDWITECSNRGCPRKIEDVKKFAQEIIIRDGRKTPFKDNKPGDSWFRNFVKRHSELTKHIS